MSELLGNIDLLSAAIFLGHSSLRRGELAASSLLNIFSRYGTFRKLSCSKGWSAVFGPLLSFEKLVACQKWAALLQSIPLTGVQQSWVLCASLIEIVDGLRQNETVSGSARAREGMLMSRTYGDSGRNTYFNFYSNLVIQLCGSPCIMLHYIQNLNDHWRLK